MTFSTEAMLPSTSIPIVNVQAALMFTACSHIRDFSRRRSNSVAVAVVAVEVVALVVDATAAIAFVVVAVAAPVLVVIVVVAVVPSLPSPSPVLLVQHPPRTSLCTCGCDYSMSLNVAWWSLAWGLGLKCFLCGAC